MPSAKSIERVCFAGVLLAYLSTRLFDLLSIPIYLDEAIHIETAKSALSGDLRAGMVLGKWFAVQCYGLVQNFFGDSLLYARLVSVVLGFVTVALIFILGRNVGGKSKIMPAAFGALIYVCAPYALFYDRLALTDQFLTVLLALIVLYTFRTAENPNLINQVLLGTVLLACPLFKFSGIFFLPVPLVVMSILTGSLKTAPRLRSLILPYMLSIPLVVIIAYYISPTGESSKMADIDSVFALSLLAITNIKTVFAIFWTMLTPSLFIGLTIGGVATVILTKDDLARRRIIAAATILIVLIFPYAIMFQCWHPHYLIPLLVPVCLIGGQVATFILADAVQARNATTMFLRYSLLLAIVAPAAVSSLHILRSPQTVPYHQAINKYFTGWTSGYGLAESIEEINRLSTNAPEGIRILRTPNWDQSSCGLDIFSCRLDVRTQRITLNPWNPVKTCSVISSILSDAKPTYLLFNSAYPYPEDRDVITKIGRTFDVDEEIHFAKPGNNPGLKIWRLRINSPHDSKLNLKISKE